MVRSTMLTAAAIAVMMGTAQGADYLFPSASIPGGVAVEDVKQFVSFIWDDNAYSGLTGTLLSEKPNTFVTEDAKIGMSWAVRGLAGRGTNPDGTPIRMTFNPTTGQMVEIYKEGGKRVGYKGNTYKTIPFDGSSTQPKDYPVAWGREMGEWPGAKGEGSKTRTNYLQEIYKEAFDAGHEIGNHTIDHMESNSPLPKEFFPAGGEGFDPYPTADLNADGSAAGPEANAFWEKIGWDTHAGRKISQSAWGHAITMGETELDNYLDISLAKDNLFAFRAPRLEVNSELYFALADQGYLYECGLEEGYESHRDGTNFIWPYTMDNGSPNAWTQKEWGSPMPLDSMPSGLWQIPVNVMIVPEADRAAVKANAIRLAEAGEVGSSWYLEDWDVEGKVTGFDFNMFVLFGMTGPQVQRTLENSLRLRMEGNKAPMQVGCHTDYFTPIYDDGPLTEDAVYKLALESNTYRDRIAAFEGFVDYGLANDAYFVSGKRLIDEIKEMQQNETVGSGSALPSDISWNFYQDEVGSSTDSELIETADIDASITLGKADIPTVNGELDYDNGQYPSSSFSAEVNVGSLENLKHISLTYKSTTPLVIRFHLDSVLSDGDQPWEALLNNVGPEVQSGYIPIDAFAYNQYVQGTKTTLETDKIVSIEIAPLSTGDDQITSTFSVKDFKTYGAEAAVALTNSVSKVNSSIAVQSMSSNLLTLDIPNAGVYDVNIVAANGRLIQSFKSSDLSTGANALSLNNLATGMYFVQINGVSNSANLVKKALVL